MFGSGGQSGVSSSDDSLDYFAATEGLEDDNIIINNNIEDSDDFHYKQRLPQPRPEQFQGDRQSVRPQSVSFDRSTTRTRSTVDRIMKEDEKYDYSDNISRQKRAASHSPLSKRSIEIRMDGRVIQLTHSNNGNTRDLTHTTTQALSAFSASEDVSTYDDDDADFSHNAQTSYPDSMDAVKDNKKSLPTPKETRRSLSWKNNNTRRIRDRDQEAVTFEEKDNEVASSGDGSDELTTDGRLVSMAKKLFNARQISLCVVKSTPCLGLLWCYRNKNALQGSTSSDRFILARLNILSFFFAAMQLVGSLWLCVVLFMKGEFQNNGDFGSEMHTWNNNGSVAFVGCLALVLMFSCVWTFRIIKEVDLVGALRFLWILLWILPVYAFLCIIVFDYHQVTSVWIKHYWNVEQMWWFRKHYCSPGTAETLCMVPLDGGFYYVSENAWCTSKYNTTACTEIRDEAQKETEFWLMVFYRSFASWGYIYMFLMLLIIKSLERIISKPMVQKSREINVVGWLTYPVFCTALFGSFFLFAPYPYLNKLDEQRWVGYLYLITSGLFLVALLMGWFLSAFSIRSNVDKQNKSNAVLILIVVLFLNAVLLISIFIASIAWSFRLNLTDLERGNIACEMKNSGCTGCNDVLLENRCPQWSYEDTTIIIQRQLKQSATLAAIFLLYDLNVMMHGLNLRKHLSMYQIDYV